MYVLVKTIDCYTQDILARGVVKMVTIETTPRVHYIMCNRMVIYSYAWVNQKCSTKLQRSRTIVSTVYDHARK